MCYNDAPSQPEVTMTKTIADAIDTVAKNVGHARGALLLEISALNRHSKDGSIQLSNEEKILMLKNLTATASLLKECQNLLNNYDDEGESV